MVQQIKHKDKNNKLSNNTTNKYERGVKMDLFNISGKRTIVTGGCQGMGNAIVHGYAQAGAKIVIFDIREDIDDVAKEVSNLYNAEVYGVRVDLSNTEDRNKAFEKAMELLGGLDVLVNCAGIQFVTDTIDFTQEDWHRVLSVNLDAVFELSQLAAKQMIPQNYGKIINFASMLSYIGGSRVPAYAASKGAVAQVTKTMCNEWAKYNININCIAPGYMDTPLNVNFMKNKERSGFILSRIPANRWGQPEDIVGVAILLASKASDYISGITIPVDGGFLAN